MPSKLWQTPRWYFAERHAKFEFTVDAAATEANALVRPHVAGCSAMCDCQSLDGPCECLHPCRCPGPIGRFYTPETNGLDPSHYTAEDRVWNNPPYDYSLLAWCKLARELSQDVGVLWDVLLPASTDTRWFHRYIWNEEAGRGGHWRDGVEGHFLPYRLKFIDPDHPEKQDPRAPNLQVTFHPKHEVAPR